MSFPGFIHHFFNYRKTWCTCWQLLRHQLFSYCTLRLVRNHALSCLLLDEVIVEGGNGRHVEVVVGGVVPLFHHGEEVVLQVVEQSDKYES